MTGGDTVAVLESSCGQHRQALEPGLIPTVVCGERLLPDVQARHAGRAARSRGRCRVRPVVVQHARALILKFKFSTGAAKASRAKVNTRTRLYYRYEI